MDNKKELKRVEGMLKKGRIGQYSLVIFTVVTFFTVIGQQSLSYALLLSAILGPLTYWIGYCYYEAFTEIIYDENAPHKNMISFFFSKKSPKRGKEVLHLLKEYKKELVKMIEEERKNAGNIDRGSMGDF